MRAALETGKVCRHKLGKATYGQHLLTLYLFVSASLAALTFLAVLEDCCARMHPILLSALLSGSLVLGQQGQSTAPVRHQMLATALLQPADDLVPEHHLPRCRLTKP